MNPEDVKAELEKKAAPVVKKPAPKAPPKLTKKPENKGPMKLMGGNPFDGATEMMMDQMGGEMNQGLDVMINGEPANDPQVIAEFVVSNPDVLAAVESLIGQPKGSTEDLEEDDDM